MRHSADEVIDSLFQDIQGRGIIIVGEREGAQYLAMGARLMAKEGHLLFLKGDYPRFDGLVLSCSPPEDPCKWTGDMMSAKICAPYGHLENFLFDVGTPQRGLDPQFASFRREKVEVDVRTILSFQIVGGAKANYHWPEE